MYQSGMRVRDRLNLFDGRIGRAVISNDDLAVHTIGQRCRDHPLQQRGDELFFVVQRNENR
jgi:hypothetical protein